MHKQVYGTTIVVACIQACLDDDKMDTESPTLPMTIIHALFSLAAKQAWDVQLINADTAFLNAAPNETIYVSLLQGLSEPGKVVLLLKSLYGTSNALKSWNTLLHNWMLMNGFKLNLHEGHTPCWAYFGFSDWSDMMVVTIVRGLNS